MFCNLTKNSLQISTPRLIFMQSFRRMHRNLYSLIRLCRQFFPPDSTAQMLDEWLPMLSPYFHSMYKAVDYLELFLPTFNCEDSRATTLDLWIDQLLAFWATINTSFGHDGVSFDPPRRKKYFENHALKYLF